ncbi:MAG TPA: plastocyanin/azurin family copper-binding protein [Thermoplasmata archaeon]|nr:plastocyanin/azurin family copper-binding protein [Thermoplasmata archaeon]
MERERPHGPTARWFFVAALASLLAGLAVTGAGARAPDFAAPASSHPHASVSVTITVGTVFAFAPASFEVQPGDSVTLTFVLASDANSPHTFTMSSVANYSFPASETSTQFTQFFASHPPIINLDSAGAGSTNTTTFTAPAKGTYEFVCLQPGHFSVGMFGVMGSGVSVTPPSTPSTGPGTGVFIIGGIIAALVITAIVLAFVIGRRRGSVHEMPPERLGYREPPAEPPKTP